MSIINIESLTKKIFKFDGEKRELKKLEKVHVRIKRQDNPDSEPYYQEFLIPYKDHMNVIMILMYIRENPVDIEGNEVKPVSFEAVV
jgi:succinate dehydrogenase / fumarate reductase iron-sulfur subunit